MSMDSSDKAPVAAEKASANSSNESKPSAPSQSHLTSAQNLFSGRPNAGLLCNNLRPNPFSVTDNSSGSSSLLAKPKFSLKPSAFNAGSSSSTGDGSAPSTVSTTNPFLRPAKLSYENDDDNGEDKTAANDKETAGNEKETAINEKEIATNEKETNNPAEEKPSTSKQSETKSSVDGTTSSSNATTTSAPRAIVAAATSAATTQHLRASSSSFVFGEALDSRVTNVNKENSTNGHTDPEEAPKPKVLTMEEAADEYKKQQESGPLLPEVETFTGEENESNVLQISCKLFLFQDKTKTWAERGRGCLRLNDDTQGVHSRIVMRTVGIHRVILNTSIWPAMVCEKANAKSIRITGTELDQVHVYLITGSAADIEHLHNAVTYRIQRAKQSSASTADSTGDSESASFKRKTEGSDEKSPKRSRAEVSEGAAK